MFRLELLHFFVIISLFHQAICHDRFHYALPITCFIQPPPTHQLSRNLIFLIGGGKKKKFYQKKKTIHNAGFFDDLMSGKLFGDNDSNDDGDKKKKHQSGKKEDNDDFVLNWNENDFKKELQDRNAKNNYDTLSSLQNQLDEEEGRKFLIRSSPTSQKNDEKNKRKRGVQNEQKVSSNKLLNKQQESEDNNNANKSINEEKKEDYDGYAFRDAIYQKWGKCYDVDFQPVQSFGFKELYLNVLPFHSGSRCFRHKTELGYLCHLQAIVEILDKYDQLEYVLSQMDETKKKPRSGTSPLVAVPFRLDLTEDELNSILG